MLQLAGQNKCNNFTIIVSDDDGYLSFISQLEIWLSGREGKLHSKLLWSLKSHTIISHCNTCAGCVIPSGEGECP